MKQSLKQLNASYGKDIDKYRENSLNLKTSDGEESSKSEESSDDEESLDSGEGRENWKLGVG